MKSKNVGLILLVVELIMQLVGFIGMVKYGGWMLAISVYVFVWGNNMLNTRNAKKLLS